MVDAVGDNVGPVSVYWYYVGNVETSAVYRTLYNTINQKQCSGFYVTANRFIIL
jgi:hypothetical protein